MITSAPLTFRGRLWRFTKRLTLLATVLLVVAVPAGTFGLPALARHPKARAKVEKALTRALGTPVQVGAMSFAWKDGLLLRDVSGDLFRIDAVALKVRWPKLLSGKVRLLAELDRPEFEMVDSGTGIRNLRLPRFGKKGLALERVKITDGSYELRSAADERTLRIDGISGEGSGRLQNRTVRMELRSITGSFKGEPVTGKGVLRLTHEGVAGELEVNDAAAKEPELRDALRAARITLRKSPAMSELY